MSFLYYLLVGISVTWLQTIDAWCPEDWNFAPGVGCYLTSDPSVQVQFDEARRICQQLGGSLVSVNEIAKRKAIENIMTDDWGHYWVGAEYNGTTKEFLWDNGSHLEKVKGRPLEGKRTCVTFRSIMKFPFGNDPITDDRNVLKFVLHADPCDIEQRFICEKRNVTVTPEPSTPPPTTPKPSLEPSYGDATAHLKISVLLLSLHDRQLRLRCCLSVKVQMEEVMVKNQEGENRKMIATNSSFARRRYLME